MLNFINRCCCVKGRWLIIKLDKQMSQGQAPRPGWVCLHFSYYLLNKNTLKYKIKPNCIYVTTINYIVYHKQRIVKEELDFMLSVEEARLQLKEQLETRKELNHKCSHIRDQLNKNNNVCGVPVSFYYCQHLYLFQGVTDFFPQPNPFSPFYPVVCIFKT